MRKNKSIGILGAGRQAVETSGYATENALRVNFFAVDAAYVHDADEQTWPRIDIAHIPKEFQDTAAITAVGSPKLKQRMVASWRGEFTSLVHPDTWIAKDAQIGLGATIAPGARINRLAQIGKHVLINQSASISHDTVVGDYATIGPGAAIAGQVTIGAGVYVGIGATIMDKLNIGDGAVIGAGAVVTSNVPPNAVMVGVPAKQLKTLTEWY